MSSSINARDKIIAARVGLLFKHPVIGDLITRLKISPTDRIPTLATDGRSVLFNSEFVDKLTIPNTEFALGHELIHVLLEHVGRGMPLLDSPYELEVWKIACDYATNQILVDEGIGIIMDKSIIELYQDDRFRNMAANEIYDILLKEYAEQRKANGEDQDGEGEGSGSGKGKGKGKGKGSGKGKPQLLDDHDSKAGSDSSSGDKNGDNDGDGDPDFGSMTEEEYRQFREELKSAIIAAASGNGIGSTPGFLKRFIAEWTESRINWRLLLRNEVQSTVKNDWTFTRPNRTYFSSGIVMPAFYQEPGVEVTFAIDASGSFSPEQLKESLSEVAGIATEYADYVVNVLTFDTEAYNFQTFTPDNIDDLQDYEIGGGGGTDFDCIFHHLKEIGHVPKILIVMTDGYTHNWGDPDYCNTIFLISGSDQVGPFGTTINYDENFK